MPSKDIVHTSQLYIKERKPVYAVSLVQPSAFAVGKPLLFSDLDSRYNKQLDPIEYGMGFQRGETNEFVGSYANRVTLQQDMGEAFNDDKWTLVPEEEHLEYLTDLWWNNLCCPPDQRERYIPLEKGLRVSRSGRTFYPYNLYRAESFPIYAIDGTLTQTGTTRVWSSIPPYVWLVMASVFMDKNYSDVPLHLCLHKCRLLYVYDMVRTPLPSVFVTSLAQPERPLPLVKKAANEAQPPEYD